VRKTGFLALALLLCLSSLAAYAEESEFYCVSIPVLRVYPHRLGYMVLYKTGNSSVHDIYLPMGWFNPGGPADVVRGTGTMYPYMSVFFKGGEFHHMRLYVSDDIHDESWAVFAQNANVDEKFKNVETLKLSF
jgi:hypothetical protein